MRTKDDLLRDLDLEEMQQFLLVAAPQKRRCVVCGRETWRPRYCSQHEPSVARIRVRRSSV